MYESDSGFGLLAGEVWSARMDGPMKSCHDILTRKLGSIIWVVFLWAGGKGRAEAQGQFLLLYIVRKDGRLQWKGLYFCLQRG